MDTANQLVAAYQRAHIIAVSFRLLNDLRTKSAKQSSVANRIRTLVPPLVVATKELVWFCTLSDDCAKASELHLDVVRWGRMVGESYLDIALQAGIRFLGRWILLSPERDRILTELFETETKQRRGKVAEVLAIPNLADVDCSGVISRWDDPTDPFCCLGSLRNGLEIALEKEHRRLLGTGLTGPVAAAQGECSYSGLIMDETRRIVFDTTHQREPTENIPNLTWKVMQRIMKSGDSYCTRENLREAWDDEMTPSDERVDDEVSRARQIFKRYGLTVKNARKIGWRLEVIPDSTITPTSRRGTSPRKKRGRT